MELSREFFEVYDDIHIWFIWKDITQTHRDITRRVNWSIEILSVNTPCERIWFPISLRGLQRIKHALVDRDSFDLLYMYALMQPRFYSGE